MSYKILIADDEERLRILVSDFLKTNDHIVIEASNGEEAINLFYEDPTIHLLILDVMMPLMDGFEVLDEIRKISQVPVIMLTAKNAEQDELKGFNTGADEYITKPFRPTILMARVKALLNRTYGSSEATIYGCMIIDTEQHSLKVHDTSIQLSQTEFKLLTYMINNQGNVLSRDQILNNVWGFDYYGTARTVDTHMNRLRIKLKDAGDYIKTIRGYGYKFEVTQ